MTVKQSDRLNEVARNLGPNEPAPKNPAQASPEQLRKFEEAARAIGADDDPERFKERVRRLASAKQASSDQATQEPKA